MRRNRRYRRRKRVGFRRRFRVPRRSIKVAGYKRFFKLRFLWNLTLSTNSTLQIKFNDDPSICTDYVHLKQLFDMYRVCAMKFTFIPSANENTLPTPTSGGPYLRPVYIVHDVNDSMPTTTNPDDFLQYDNCKIRPMDKMWKYYVKMRRNIITTNYAVLDSKAYQSTGIPQSTQIVSVLFTGIGNAVPIDLGKVVQTFYCAFKSVR